MQVYCQQNACSKLFNFPLNHTAILYLIFGFSLNLAGGHCFVNLFALSRNVFRKFSRHDMQMQDYLCPAHQQPSATRLDLEHHTIACSKYYRARSIIVGYLSQSVQAIIGYWSQSAQAMIILRCRIQLLLVTLLYLCRCLCTGGENINVIHNYHQFVLLQAYTILTCQKAIIVFIIYLL